MTDASEARARAIFKTVSPFMPARVLIRAAVGLALCAAGWHRWRTNTQACGRVGCTATRHKRISA